MTAAQDEISAFFAADPDVIAWPYPMYERWQAAPESCAGIAARPRCSPGTGTSRR